MLGAFGEELQFVSQIEPRASAGKPLKPARRSRTGEFLNGLAVRQRLHVLVGVFGVAVVLVLAVSVYGLLGGRSSASSANTGFDSFAVEQSAYEVG